LRHLNPFPGDLGDILSRFKKILVPEMNMGHLVKMLRAEYLVDAIGLNKIQGLPFKVSEITNRIKRMLEA
jgi:2-oxoglutarate ferredoxin oxidoreductase subunit alpha